jgi:CDP-6-deoxy-D-xylo-4-hexulose-3-dehydrase
MSCIKNNELDLHIDENNFISNFAMPILSKNRDSIVENLIKNNIECRPLIAGNLANKPFWYENFIRPKLKNCELLDQYGFYIPNHQDLTSDNLNKITKIINNG